MFGTAVEVRASVRFFEATLASFFTVGVDPNTLSRYAYILKPVICKTATIVSLSSKVMHKDSFRQQLSCRKKTDEIAYEPFYAKIPKQLVNAVTSLCSSQQKKPKRET
ncbi:hypothetical protein MTR_4g108400 [Medicago truncatula]|uniref:Uncharacterized protein n=1 Tax=Medicago truncatula TaxID=3880 RepID=G7JQY6_MEDTR|nr:hypothetical protein MTR_4g108400 [Medicago truncatula]